MVTGKIANVPDATCETCSQCWEGGCRAFQMSQSHVELEHRKSGVMACFKARERQFEVQLAKIKSGQWTLDELHPEEATE